jgi:hypothetical protein
MKVLYLKALSAKIMSVHWQNRVYLGAQHQVERGSKRVLGMDENSGEIDWLRLSKSKRVPLTKDLYLAVSGVADAIDVTILELIDTAFAGLPAVGTDYSSNFRRGNVSAAKAMLMHRWLEENHFELAQKLAPELFQTNPKSAWDRFIDANAIVGKLHIVQLKSEAGLIERDDHAVPVGDTIRLTQRFCFELRTEIRGSALAFQKYEGQWHSLPLGADSRNLKGTVSASPQLLPRDGQGNPIGLRENNDAGHHEFGIIVSDDRTLPTDMKKIARLTLSTARFEVHRITVKFVT